MFLKSSKKCVSPQNHLNVGATKKRNRKSKRNDVPIYLGRRYKLMRKFKIITTASLAVFFLCVLTAHAGPSLTGLINSDFKAGKISFDDAVIYKALMVQTPWVLPKKYQPKTPLRDTTPVVLEVLAELKDAHPEVQSYVSYIFTHPKNREKTKTPTLYSVFLSRKDIATLSLEYYKKKDKIKKGQYLTPEGHFTVHYSENGKDSSTLTYAQQVGKYLEESWSHEVDTLDYDAPELGDDGRMDIFILDLGADLYGTAYPPGGDTEGYININKDFSWAPFNDDPGGDAVGALKVTTAHEFFHQIQFEYLNELSRKGEVWWIESSATFIEDEVFDEVNDYENYMGVFFSETHVPIDEIGKGYETVLINKLLKEQFNNNGSGIVNEVLDGIGLITSAEESMGKALKNRGYNLAECFRDFALWNFFTGTRYRSGYYEEGSQYPTFSNFQSVHSIGDSNSSIGEQTDQVDNLAANYYKIEPESSLADAKTLSIQVAKNSDVVMGRLVVRRKSGDVDVRDLTFDSDNKAEELVDDFSFATIHEVVLILSNGSEHSAKDVAYSAALVAGLDLIFVIDTTGSMWDDIANVKASSTAIVNMIDAELADYRIAVVDYRDFPVSPYGGSIDYPYHVNLPFSTDKAAIINALQGLTLGWGYDWEESVYSALIRSINTEGLSPWREGVKKNIILLGDAPPHDPEPFTGYTMDSVVSAAKSIPSITGSALSRAADTDAEVSIYGISIGYDSTTYSYFASLSEQTGGKVFRAPNASDIVDKIIEAIGEIEKPEENHPPNCSGAVACLSELWPPNHKMKAIQILNIEDPDGDPVFIKITQITQDEPVSGTGKGDKSPDGEGIGTATAWVRAERDGNGNSRVYKISFVAYDDKGAQCSGSVLVGVPHDQGLNTVCIDDGQTYDSTASSGSK